MNLLNSIATIPLISLFSIFSMGRSSGQIVVPVVTPFAVSRYAGQWFEIARMDFWFERNLSDVTANYSLNENGTIKVVNRGFDTVKNVWKRSIGKAKFAGNRDEAKLKVSFFGPFYAAYNVIALDKDYRYALIAGGSPKYLWILSREITIPDAVRDSYLKIASDLGYDTSSLTWTRHGKKKE
jgi:apolipoprotein D and lipocalin family protein